MSRIRYDALGKSYEYIFDLAEDDEVTTFYPNNQAAIDLNNEVEGLAANRYPPVSEEELKGLFGSP